MGNLISIERERAVRDLREEVGATEADRILERVAVAIARAEVDPAYRRWLEECSDGREFVGE